LRATPGPAAHDPRIDLAEAVIAQQDKNYRHEQMLAEKVLVTAHNLGAQGLQARAYMLIGDALYHQLKPQDALQAYSQAQMLFEKAYDPAGTADADSNMGTLLFQQGDLQGARKSFEKARDLFRRVGDEKRLSSALKELAKISRSQGDVSGADRLEEESDRILHRLGPGRAISWESLPSEGRGVSDLRIGDDKSACHQQSV
jgi:tetratricopeptide (TPR) repeat protein